MPDTNQRVNSPIEISRLVSMFRYPDVLLLTLLLVASAPPVDAADSSLYGRWQMDVERSDDISKVIDDFLRRNKSKRDRSGEGRREGPSVAEAAGISHDRKGGVTLLVSDYIPGIKLLMIEPAQSGITIRYEGLEPRLINTSGGTSTISAVGKPRDGHRSVTIAGWENGNLYSEVTTEQGIRIFESYLLSGTLLIIETQFRYPVLEPLTVTRRFNRLPTE